MACAKPVVGGAHGGTPDVIDDGVTGYLVAQNDLEMLHDRLLQLLTNESLRRDMGTQGRARVLRDYIFERFSHNLSALLGELLILIS
jgi:colanic acid/amylovoran biosynthesis glycosyltransferase